MQRDYAHSDRGRGARPLLAGLALIASALSLAACESAQSTVDGAKSFLQTAGKEIDRTLGIAPDLDYEMLEPEDVTMAEAAKHRALETRRDGEGVTWRNVKTGNSGSITPVSTYVNEGGVFCREFKEILSIGVEKGEATGVRCRTDAQNWTPNG